MNLQKLLKQYIGIGLVLVFIVGCKSTPTSSLQFENVTVEQTCRHTTLTLSSGKKMRVTSGLLFVKGEVNISNTSSLPIVTDVLPIKVKNVGEKALCTLQKLNPQTNEWESVKDAKYTIQEQTTEKFRFSCTTEDPKPGMTVIFPSSFPNNTYVIIPDGEEPMSIALLSGPLVEESYIHAEGNIYDMVEFKCAITNSSNVTWIFDYGEVIKAVDDYGSRYGLMKPGPDCPQIIITPGERQELSLRYMTLNAETNPHLVYYTPLGDAPIPAD